MKNEKLYPKEKQKGVVFYRNKLASQDMSEDPEDIDAIDIDVDDEVKEVVICYDLIMADSKKSFPNVESLVIKSNVFEIRIPNSLFPNVKWVQSERDRFKTGNCLVLDEGNIFCTLLNTFCKKEGEVIKIDDITAIKNGAFSGCESTNLTGAIDVYCGDDIEPDAFAGSAFAKQPFVNGVKMAGNIVIDIDKTSEEIIIPDYDYEKAIFIANTDLTMVKKLVVHRYETARQVNYDTNFPEMLVLDTNDSLSGVEIRELAHISSSAVSYLKYFSISNGDYKTIDGIVYTKNGKIVVAGSLGLEHVVIPEGVEKLGHSVFRNCKMKSVVLPDSIDRIRAKAFCQCENLKSVKLGNNVDTIEDSAFAECCSLKHIGECAFIGCRSISSLKLPDSIKKLGYRSLCGMNKLKELEIPGSVEDSNCYCELEGMTTAIKFGEGVSEVYLSSSCALTSYQSMVRRVELPSTVTKFSDYRREELARVRVVTLQTENTPQNLLLAMIPETRYKPNGYSYSSCEALKNEIYCIQTPERTILVPSNISEKSIQEINDTMNRIGAYIPANLFRYCKDIKQKLPMAFLEWQNSHDEATKRYLKRNRKKLVQDLVEEGMDEALARFLKTGIYEKKEMQDVYDIIAEADSMKMSKAYALDIIGSGSKNTFRL